MLTPDQGKLSLMARGVRKPKSKLAGGIELFSTSQITYMPGRGEIGTLISARLEKNYAAIVRDINRVQLSYEIIKTINKATEDHPGPEYFGLLQTTFEALNNYKITDELIKTWFQAQLLRHSGHSPNLITDTSGDKLSIDQNYNFDYDHVAFSSQPAGQYLPSHIKFLRLLFSDNTPLALSRVVDSDKLLKKASLLIQTMLQTYIRL